MDKVIIAGLTLFLIFSCRKDKTYEPCTGVTMSDERSLFVGTWRWYGTTIEQWFDIGPSNFYEVTPQSEGFNYYFTITENGLFKGYRDSILEHEFILSRVTYENFNGTNADVIELKLDCTSDELELIKYAYVITNDTIHTHKLPVNFVDDNNHLKSHRNHFVKG